MSKNYERYKKWYEKGSITDEQLEKLVEVGLLTQEEMNIIKNSK